MSYIGELFFITLVASTSITWFYLRWARRHQVVDQPNHRSSHAVPTPRGGGVGIVLPLVACFFIWSRQLDSPFLMLGCGTVVLAAVSWVDDLRGLPALFRLAVHVGVGAWVVVALGASFHLPGSWAEEHRWMTSGLLIAWMVMHINFYNFMDGIDGLAAGQTALLGLAWMGVGWSHNSITVIGVGYLLLAANLGFLLFNWPPAKIFMGDIGSASIGFLAGVMPLLSTSPTGTDALIFGSLVSWPFIFDATATLGLRLIRRENVLKAHRSHFYQRLVASGWSHCTVTLIYLGWTIICATAGIVWLAGQNHRHFIAAAALILPAVSLAKLTAIRCKRISANS